MRQTLYRNALKGLKSVSLKLNLIAELCDGSFFPVVKANLEKTITEILVGSGIEVARNVPAQLKVEVRTRLLALTETPGAMVKIETMLQEPVTIARSGFKTEVDTWRHRSVAAVYVGLPDPAQVRQLIETEVLRQVELFATDVTAIGDPEDSPANPPTGEAPIGDPPAAGKACRKIKLGQVDGVPEIKTVMEDQVVGPPWAQIKVAVPVVYTRTSSAKASVEVCGAPESIDHALKEIEACATMSAGAVTLAAIVAGPEAALAAFKRTFTPCLESKWPGLAAQIGIALKVDQVAGEWRRRT